MSGRKLAAGHQRESNLPRKQSSLTALGRWENTQICNSGKVMAHRPINIPHPFLSLPFPSLFCIQSEGPIAGPADKAVTTSCQVIPFIVRKHPCKGKYPTVSAQVKEQQVRVESRKLSQVFSLGLSITHSLLKRDRNAVLNIPTIQEVNNSLTAPIRKQFA